MDKLPLQIKEFLQDGTRVEAMFPHLSKDERLVVHRWISNGRRPLEHASFDDPAQGRVLRLKKLQGEFTEVTPLSHFTPSPNKPPKTSKTPKTPRIPKAPKAPGDTPTKAGRKRKIDYSSASDLANLVGQTIQPPNGGLPVASTYAAPNHRPTVKPGVYDDKKPMFIRGLVAHLKSLKTLEYHNDHRLDLLKKVTTNLSLYVGSLRTPQQAKEQIEGIGLDLTTKLVDIQASGCVDNTPPPPGYFVCAAPAMLVALLHAKRNEQLEFLSKEQLMERASQISEEKFDPIHIGGNVEHVAWSRIHHLDKRNFVKLHQRKKISINGVYKLEPLGEEMAYRLLGEIPPTLPTSNPPIPSSPTFIPSSPKATARSLPPTPTRAPPRPAAPILAPVTDLNVQALYSHGVGTDGIFVLVDDREYGGGRHKLGEVCNQLKELNIKHMSRRLKVADYMFVKRIAGVEFVVPLLIERKRMDDLASSLKTPRFQKQKDAMLYLKQRFEKMALQYVVEGNVFAYRDQIINAGFTGAHIEDIINLNKSEGFEVIRVVDIKDSIKHVAELSTVLTLSVDDELTRMLIGTFEDFENVVKEWRRQNKKPKTTKGAPPPTTTNPSNHNPITITPKRSSAPSPSSTTTATTTTIVTTTTTTLTTPAPPVTCPVCNNILIGSQHDNTAHIDSCLTKRGGGAVVIRHNADNADVRECPNCNANITGTAEKFARHVEYCLV